MIYMNFSHNTDADNETEKLFSLRFKSIKCFFYCIVQMMLADLGVMQSHIINIKYIDAFSFVM